MTAAFRTSAAGGSTSGTTDRTVAITAALDDLIVVCASLATNTNVAPTCSDNKGGIYKLVHAGLRNGGADMQCMFVRAGPCGFASSHTITVATGSNTSGSVVAVAISGMSRWGTDAIRQVASQDAQAAGTPAPVFGVAALTGSVLVGMVANATNPATMTAPSGWTERQDVGQITNTEGLEVATIDSGFTSTTVTWGSSSATAFGSIALELDTSAAPTFPGASDASQRQFNTAPTTGTQTTAGVTTPVSGSTILLGAARGTWANGTPTLPTDNKSNTYSSALAGGPRAYNGFPTSETAIVAKANAAGGSSHTASLGWGVGSAGSGDEVTISLVEIDNTNVVQDSSWADQPNLQNTSTSGNVTTTGPAVLIAYFYGYGNTGQLHNFRPQSDQWRRLPGACTDGDPVGWAGYIQCTVLWTTVAAAGTYSVVASGVAQEGAQIYLVAVQLSHTGDASDTLDAVGISAGGTVASSGVTGDASPTIGAVTDSGAGTVPVQGASTPTVGAVTSTAAGSVPVQGVGNPTIGPVIDVAAGSVPAQGAASSTIDPVTSAATGTLPVQGASTTVIGAVTEAGAGAVSVQGAASPLVGAVASTATGGVLDQGNASPTVGAVTSTATGGPIDQGAGSNATGDVVASGSGTAAAAGSASSPLGTINSSGEGSVGVGGDASGAVGDVSLSAAGAVGVAGDASATIGDVATSATGVVFDAGVSTGDASPMIDDVVSSGDGAVEIAGDASPTIAAFAGTGQAQTPPPLTGGGGGGYWPTYKREAKTRLIRSAREQHGATVTVWVLEDPSDSTQSFTSGSRIQFIASFRRNGEDWDYDVSATVSDSRGGEKPQVVHRASRGVYYIEVKVTTGVMTVRFTTPDGADSETTYLVTPALAGRAAGPVSTRDARVDGESWKSYYRRLGKRGR